MPEGHANVSFMFNTFYFLFNRSWFSATCKQNDLSLQNPFLILFLTFLDQLSRVHCVLQILRPKPTVVSGGKENVSNTASLTLHHHHQVEPFADSESLRLCWSPGVQFGLSALAAACHVWIPVLYQVCGPDLGTSVVSVQCLSTSYWLPTKPTTFLPAVPRQVNIPASFSLVIA